MNDWAIVFSSAPVCLFSFTRAKIRRAVEDHHKEENTEHHRTKERGEMEEQTEEQQELQLSKSRETLLLRRLAWHERDLTPQIGLRKLGFVNCAS